jgi:hypothetical protein
LCSLIGHLPSAIARAFPRHWRGLYHACTTHVPSLHLPIPSQAHGLYLACTWLWGSLGVAFDVECPGQFLELCDPGAHVVPSCLTLSRRDGSRMCHPGTLSRRRRVAWKAETTGPARWSARAARCRHASPYWSMGREVSGCPAEMLAGQKGQKNWAIPSTSCQLQA